MKINEIASNINNFIEQNRLSISAVAAVVATVAGSALGIAVSPILGIIAVVSALTIMTAMVFWPEPEEVEENVARNASHGDVADKAGELEGAAESFRQLVKQLPQ